MKKTYFFLFLFPILAFQGNTQIIYEFSDFATAGDSYEYEVKSFENTDTITLSDFDENWDFTAYEADSMITVNFVLPEETTFGDSFPNANLCLMEDEENYSYMHASEAGVKLVGIATDNAELGIPFVYAIEEDFTITQFPVQVGNEGNNQTSFTIADSPENLGLDLDSLDLPVDPDSLRLTVSITDHSEIDDYGTVTLADGDYETIRENRMEIFDVTVEMQVFTIWLPLQSFADTTHSYHWLAKDHGFPIAEVFAGPNDLVFSISFLKTIPQYVRQFANHKTLLYPNPARDYLFLNDENVENPGKIEIFDMQGKLVKQFDNQQKSLKVRDLSSGMYMYSVFDKNGRIIHSDKFYKTH